MKFILTFLAFLCFIGCSDKQEPDSDTNTTGSSAPEKADATLQSESEAPVDPPHPDDTSSRVEIHATY